MAVYDIVHGAVVSLLTSVVYQRVRNASFFQKDDSTKTNLMDKTEIRDNEHVKPSKGRAPSACIDWTLDVKSRPNGLEMMTFDLQSRENRPERWTFDLQS